MKEGKASALGDWVGGMAAPGGPSVPQVEEGKESWLPTPQWRLRKAWRAHEIEPGTGLILLQGVGVGGE